MCVNKEGSTEQRGGSSAKWDEIGSIWSWDSKSKRLAKIFLCTLPIVSIKLCDDTPSSSRIFCPTIPGAVWKVVGLLYYMRLKNLSKILLRLKILTWANIRAVNFLLPFYLSDFLSPYYKWGVSYQEALFFLTSRTIFLLSGPQTRQGILFYMKVLEGGFDKRLNPR